MKIGYLLPYFWPFEDGTENNCLYLAREMAKLGHEVHVFTSDRRDGKIVDKKEEMIQGIHVHRSRTLARYRYYLSLNPSLISMILRQKLDVLHIHSFGFPIYDLVLILKKLTSRTKIINTPHGGFMALPRSSYSWWQRILRSIFVVLEYPINRLYDAVIQVNTLQWKWIVKYGPSKKRIVYVPDGIPADRFRKVNKADFVKRYGLKGKFVISNLGRVQKYKGLDQVIKILPDIVRKHPNVVFLSMGPDRGDMDRLKKLAEKLGVEKYVIFTGMVSEDDKLKGLDATDVFILPSEWEAFGIVTLEAYARKTPAICTTMEGGQFLVEDGVNGFLYDFQNLKQLKEKMLALIENPKLRKQMSETNYKKAVDLTNESIARNYLEKVYLNLVKKNKNREKVLEVDKNDN